mmetsp:Transcript_51094/g.150587  ORF Transcript_51094/g.150587 Transcript_51094/m.150587 type:complete len:336 (-) Transcript_51094:605-1612(-)
MAHTIAGLCLVRRVRPPGLADCRRIPIHVGWRLPGACRLTRWTSVCCNAPSGTKWAPHDRKHERTSFCILKIERDYCILHGPHRFETDGRGADHVVVHQLAVVHDLHADGLSLVIDVQLQRLVPSRVAARFRHFGLHLLAARLELHVWFRQLPAVDTGDLALRQVDAAEDANDDDPRVHLAASNFRRCGARGDLFDPPVASFAEGAGGVLGAHKSILGGDLGVRCRLLLCAVGVRLIDGVCCAVPCHEEPSFERRAPIVHLEGERLRDVGTKIAMSTDTLVAEHHPQIGRSPSQLAHAWAVTIGADAIPGLCEHNLVKLPHLPRHKLDTLCCHGH